MLNPFFLNNSKQEQGLIQSLVNEQLKMYGIEIYYIPRRYVKKASVIREVIQSEFDNAYPIEAYLDSYEGYGGQGTLLSKFGIQESDDMTLIVSRERYENYITPLIKNIPNIELSTRPKEGDLIYEGEITEYSITPMSATAEIKAVFSTKSFLLFSCKSSIYFSFKEIFSEVRAALY